MQNVQLIKHAHHHSAAYIALIDVGIVHDDIRRRFVEPQGQLGFVFGKRQPGTNSTVQYIPEKRTVSSIQNPASGDGACCVGGRERKKKKKKRDIYTISPY